MKRPIKAATTRWLTRGLQAANLNEIFLDVSAVLEDDSREPLNKMAQSLLPHFHDPSFQYWVAFYSDVTEILNSLSRKLQERDLCVIEVRTMVSFINYSKVDQPVTKRMRDLFDDNNFIFVGFSQKDQLAIRRMHRTGHEFVSHLITQLKARFPSESIDIIGSLAALFPKRMCKGDGLISFGLEDMDKIITFYGHILDVTTLIDEYQE
jgi:hypothetical protein